MVKPSLDAAFGEESLQPTEGTAVTAIAWPCSRNSSSLPGTVLVPHHCPLFWFKCPLTPCSCCYFSLGVLYYLVLTVLRHKSPNKTPPKPPNNKTHLITINGGWKYGYFTEVLKEMTSSQEITVVDTGTWALFIALVLLQSLSQAQPGLDMGKCGSLLPSSVLKGNQQFVQSVCYWFYEHNLITEIANCFSGKTAAREGGRFPFCCPPGEWQRCSYHREMLQGGDRLPIPFRALSQVSLTYMLLSSLLGSL